MASSRGTHAPRQVDTQRLLLKSNTDNSTFTVTNADLTPGFFHCHVCCLCQPDPTASTFLKRLLAELTKVSNFYVEQAQLLEVRQALRLTRIAGGDTVSVGSQY